MMITIKIIAISIATLSGLIQIGLEYYWRDRRTTKHKIIRRLLIVLMVSGFFTAVVLVVYDDKDAQHQINALTDLKLKAEEGALGSAKRERKAQEDRKKIQNKLDKINEQMKPLLDIAAAKYPNLSVDKALHNLAERIKTIEADSVNTKKELNNTKQELLKKTSDRCLPEAQKQILKSSLTGISGKVIIEADYFDSEAQLLADQIKDVFAQTELEVLEKAKIGLMSLYAKGIRMLVNDLQNPPFHALPILKAFEGVGVQIKVSSTGKAKIPQGVLVIWVCHK